jgi:hypothetical protein
MQNHSNILGKIGKIREWIRKESDVNIPKAFVRIQVLSVIP